MTFTPIGGGQDPIIGSNPQHPGNMLAQEFYELLETSGAVVVAGLLIFTLIFGLRKIKAMANASS